MSASNEVKLISLKLMVDTKANKVLFAEAAKEFVDFIIHILSMPLATVAKLLNENQKTMTATCLVDLYKSVESLNCDYFEIDKSKILNPKPVAVVPLLSPKINPDNSGCIFLEYYKCPSHAIIISDHQGIPCPVTLSENCRESTKELLRLVYVFPTASRSSTGIPSYVKGPMSYMVIDNLEVKPMSVSLITSLVKGLTSIVEKQVQLGPLEGIAMLKASLETKYVLTTVFLGMKMNMTMKREREI